MIRRVIPLLLALLLTAAACRTIPGRDVRYEPTPMRVVRAMLELANVARDDVVYDLGSGDGRIPITAATEFGARLLRHLVRIHRLNRGVEARAGASCTVEHATGV